MLQLHYSPDKITYTAAISTCTDCIQWHQALALLQKAKVSSLQLDVIPYNATITACEKASRWNQAMLLLTSIEENQLQADSLSFTVTW
jgi:pentatricopeptide repeat domain-containing protein 1